jgi:hypothetical protein
MRQLDARSPYSEPMLEVFLIALLLMGIFLIAGGVLPREVPADPHCGACNYDVRGLTMAGDQASPCPECGRDLSRTMRQYRKVRRPKWIAGGAALAVVGSIPIVWALVDSGYGSMSYRYQLFDLNSGRERHEERLLGLRIWATEHETPLSQLIAESGGRLGPPEWVAFRYKGRGLASARVNFRYGPTPVTLAHLVDALTMLDVPQHEHHRIARTALAAVKAEQRLHLELDFQEGRWLRVLSADGRDRVIVEWRADDP